MKRQVCGPSGTQSPPVPSDRRTHTSASNASRAAAVFVFSKPVPMQRVSHTHSHTQHLCIHSDVSAPVC